MLYLKKMGKKCIICESKNDGKKKPSVISFYKIQHQRRNDKQNRWISAVKEFDPAIVVKNDRLIYSLHWPVNIPTTPYYGRERPVDPSSIFPQRYRHFRSLFLENQGQKNETLLVKMDDTQTLSGP